MRYRSTCNRLETHREREGKGGGGLDRGRGRGHRGGGGLGDLALASGYKDTGYKGHISLSMV